MIARSNYPKKPRQLEALESRRLMTADFFLDTFDGNPTVPTRFVDPNWDVAIMTRNRTSWIEANPGNIAAHGPDCSPPPATHDIVLLDDMVFQCKDHLMTAMNDDSFGVVTLTPNHMLDLSGPEAKVSFDISTLRSGGYDWIELVITPFEDNLVHPAADIWEVAGPPENSIRIAMTPGTDNKFTMALDQDDESFRYIRCGDRCEGANWWTTYDTPQLPLIPDARRRETFELTITDDDRISFGVIEYFDGVQNNQSFYWLDDVDVSPLDWDSAVVQLQHFSFNPTNNCGNPSCDGDTWHWDNVRIEPAIPFSIIPSTERFIDPLISPDNVVEFMEPSGEDAYLRFSAIGTNMEISIDGGTTWLPAELQRTAEDTESLYGRFRNYFHQIPAGVEAVEIRGEDWWGGDWHARDFSIWSETLGSVEPPEPTDEIEVADFERIGGPDELLGFTVTFDAEPNDEIEVTLSAGSEQIDLSSVTPTWHATGLKATYDLSSMNLEPARYQIAIDSQEVVEYTDEVLVTWTGDATLDGRVDFDDFMAMVLGYTKESPNWSDCDFNDDDVIDFADVLPLLENFGKTVD